MTEIEDRLRDAMAARAESVRDDGRPRALPAPRGTSGARWWAPIAVAAAIVTVVAATVAGTRTVTPPTPAVPPVPTVPTARPTPRTGVLAPPVRQVWPGAVHEIPATGPGGRVFTPDVFVTGRVVAGRGLTRNRLDGIWSYDVDRRRFTRIAPLKNPNVMNAPLVFGDGYLAWSTLRDRLTEIWAVPVTGGVPRRIASVAAVLVDDTYRGVDLAIAGGAAVWSPLDGGGVYRAPLTGGKASLVDGTRGFHLVDWPWAGRPEQDMMSDRPAARPMESLKNVLTGETRGAAPPAGLTSWSDCGVTWCLNGAEAWRRDGTNRHGLPGTAHGLLYSGRFVLLHQRSRDGRGASSLHDVATGRTGLLFPVPTRRGDKAPPTLYVHEGMFRFRSGPGRQVLVDLNAAGR
ncbi:hypothetical protein AB0G15_11505 [Streptosporangium sp. NPDC023825]|uniref:hypothetical protein n=1 Tax=Streptosporangium sp. NPDC023825 TaxID=3154909 RepID=UPI00341E652B